MPEKPRAIQTRLAEALADFKREFPPRVAELMRPVPGNVAVSKRERQARWWQTEKGWTEEKERQLLMGGMSRQDVGLLKYPHREIDARTAGRGDKRREAEYARDMTALGPPAPEPLEQAALDVEQAKAEGVVGVNQASPFGLMASQATSNGDGQDQYDYSSTQLDIPEPLAARVRAMSQSIPDTDLAEDGREDQPHVTVKYGLEADSPDVVRAIVARHGPVTVTLGKTSLFPANKQDGGKPGDFDVVKLDVDSPELRALNAALSKLPNEDEHPTYQPHLTLAYVKPGMGEKYAGRADLEGQQVTIDSLAFSSKDGQVTMLPLGRPY